MVINSANINKMNNLLSSRTEQDTIMWHGIDHGSISSRGAVFQPYYGENQLHFDEMMMMSAVTRPTLLVGFL
jgi:hypothetical protein